MQRFSLKSALAVSASAAMLAGAMAAPAHAQTSDGFNAEDEIISIGTRRQARSAADTPAPVDVISGVEFTQNAANDVQDLLRTALPSYNVNTQPISDAASIVRPANLRGLSPDNTLVLVNGKRRHRGAVISFLGGGIADGAQGVDVSSIPSIALKQVQVLRDGASSQYGSDAIAGVIGFDLKDASEGGSFEVKYGSTYDGDGDNYSIAGNVGLPLGDAGFVNISGEYGDTDGTVRAAPRTDVTNLIAAGNTAVSDFRTINSYTDEFTQYWGQPDVENDLKLAINTGIELNESAELYAFGTYAERTTTGGFFYRNPTNRGGVYRGPTVNNANGNEARTVSFDNDSNMWVFDADGTEWQEVVYTPNGDGTFDRTPSQTNLAAGEFGPSVRVGNVAGLDPRVCPQGIPLTGTDGLITDDTILASVTADDNCFSFVEAIPGGFVPRFGGDLEDIGLSAGIRGDLDFGNGLSYDLSVTHGSSEVQFFINNTVNASLGPIAGSGNTEVVRDFIPGGQKQKETIVNADFGYGIAMDGWASDLNIGFGAEYRKETFDLYAGGSNSFALGPLAVSTPAFPFGQGFSSSSNGFGGFPNSSSNSQDSYAGYIDLEGDVTDALTLQAALRYEDYSSFGDTLNYKLAALYKINDNVRVRGTYSTGFHAPTAGQANITNVTTQNVNGVLVDQGTLPLNTAAGQLAADFIASTGDRPTLGAEDARNISLGVAFDTGGFNWTVDYFNIKVDDRVALGANVDFLEALQFAGATADSISGAIAELDGNGTINRQDFLGLDDLAQFRFFSNSFDTKTQGIDVRGDYKFEMAGGDSTFIVAANWTDTEVVLPTPISDTRIRALEDLLPNVKGSATLLHSQGMWNGMVRANYYGSWFDSGNGFDVGSEILIDAEIGAEVYEGVELMIGANNLFDNYPDENPGQGGSGQLYPEASPIGFAGGQYYVKARYTF
ncbi:TonB-dependent receptor plug domain-containing protein [Hellea balneolensis]|uniref:TonB-dependent receptor plug domain-containing protein n=1 Tax=Hellea balneolensis TaxID=287478 RepID=UPI0004014D0D|nr:TonB-dependent receptor [Hellea balneolensis]